MDSNKGGSNLCIGPLLLSLDIRSILLTDPEYNALSLDFQIQLDHIRKQHCAECHLSFSLRSKTCSISLNSLPISAMLYASALNLRWAHCLN